MANARCIPIDLGGGGAHAGCVTVVLPRLRVRLRWNGRKNLGTRSTCVGSLTRKKMRLTPSNCECPSKSVNGFEHLDHDLLGKPPYSLHKSDNPAETLAALPERIV